MLIRQAAESLRNPICSVGLGVSSYMRCTCCIIAATVFPLAVMKNFTFRPDRFFTASSNSYATRLPPVDTLKTTAGSATLYPLILVDDNITVYLMRVAVCDTLIATLPEPVGNAMGSLSSESSQSGFSSQPRILQFWS